MRLAPIAALLLIGACGQASSGVASGQVASDSAAGVWLRRAAAQPEIASWLYLRAASATPDSAARRSLYARVTLPLARERIPWTEAAAREAFGDTLGALHAYSALPAPITVLRLRAELRPASLDSVRSELVSLIAAAASASSAREATTVFDSLFKSPTSDEQLKIARTAARTGSWARARYGFGAIPLARLAPADRFVFASVLSRVNADRQAASMFATIASPARLAHAARYQRARSLLAAGDRAAALSVLATLARSTSDTSAAAALALTADLQTDDNHDAASRATLLQIVRRFPRSRFAGPARFDAALIALIRGNAKTAAREFAALATATRSEADAASYWLGRARESAGDSAAARSAWRSVISDDSTSYYASLAAHRLGVASMHSSAAPTEFRRVASVDSALYRVALLEKFGMSPEAQLENDRLFREALGDSARLLATASAFSGTDQAARAIALGRTALNRFGSTPAIWRLIFPVAARDTIVSESKKAGLDPALVAALIRQESNFNPGARSPAGARGLMQLIPSVGKAIAPSAGIANWNPNMLYDPGINIELGVRHLAPLVKAQPNIPRTLAAYNAGESRVTRWAKKRGADDPEIFTERIPFAETRNYVKSVLRNREFYRALYVW